ncbi:MAG TPA: site-specific DNA-methyltransferase [Thermoplasmata archaeon]|nr:site-specific DNA-methyltransferase [Thermoplasmata archaeon]
MADPGPFAEIPTAKGASVVLWNEDSLTGLRRRVPRHGVDVIVTSPPYNLGVRYGRYNDDRPIHDYLGWIGAFRDSVTEALGEHGSLFLNIAGPPRRPGHPWDVAREVEKGLVLQNVIHWVKSIAIPRSAVGEAAGLARDLAVGHYKPVNSDRFLHGAHEYIFHFSRRGDVRLDKLAVGVPYQDRSNIGRWAGASGGLRSRGNTWFLPYPTIRYRKSDRPHPASFPPELPEMCLRVHGVARTRLAADPFLGIGPSAVAAARLGIPFVGFDIDPEYLAEAERRVRATPVSPVAGVGTPAVAPAT